MSTCIHKGCGEQHGLLEGECRTCRSYLDLDDQQAAQLFRSLVRPGACQFEDGRMIWWLQANLRLELVAGEWRLYISRVRL